MEFITCLNIVNKNIQELGSLLNIIVVEGSFENFFFYCSIESREVGGDWFIVRVVTIVNDF
jgi:hypothetical protein